MPPSLSIPLINAQVCEAEMKEAELNCRAVQSAHRLQQAHWYSGDNKTAAMFILTTFVGLLFSPEKTDQGTLRNQTDKQNW